MSHQLIGFWISSNPQISLSINAKLSYSIDCLEIKDAFNLKIGTYIRVYEYLFCHVPPARNWYVFTVTSNGFHCCGLCTCDGKVLELAARGEAWIVSLSSIDRLLTTGWIAYYELKLRRMDENNSKTCDCVCICNYDEDILKSDSKEYTFWKKHAKRFKQQADDWKAK